VALYLPAGTNAPIQLLNPVKAHPEVSALQLNLPEVLAAADASPCFPNHICKNPLASLETAT
jgi:hypothetical protein